jgi:hypothetical protein
MLEAPGDPSEELITFHVKMLRKLKKSVSMDKWEKVLTRCRPLSSSVTVTVLICSVADPDLGSGAFLTPGSGMGKKSGSGSGMNLLNHISESLETIFWVNVLKFFHAVPDPGSGNLFDPESGIRDGTKLDPR